MNIYKIVTNCRYKEPETKALPATVTSNIAYNKYTNLQFNVHKRESGTKFCKRLYTYIIMYIYT